MSVSRLDQALTDMVHGTKAITESLAKDEVVPLPDTSVIIFSELVLEFLVLSKLLEDRYTIKPKGCCDAS